MDLAKAFLVWVKLLGLRLDNDKSVVELNGNLMSRDDFDIPDFGPAEMDERPKQPGGRKTSRQKPSKSEPRQGGGAGTAVLIFALFLACGGLGYMAFMQHQQSAALSMTVQKLQTQVTALQDSLSMAESEAQNSGSSLQAQLASLNNQVKSKNKQLDSEIAKLWTVAYQRNKPAIEALQAKLDTLSSQSEELDKKITSVSGGISSLYERIDAATVAESDARSEDIKKIRTEIASLQTSFVLTEETVNEANRQLQAQQRELVDRVNALALSSDTAELERRVKTSEQAIKSIDNTRREVNNTLIQLKSRVNSLQLKVEKISP